MTIQTKVSRTVREWALYLEDKGYLVAAASPTWLGAAFDLLTLDSQGNAKLWRVTYARGKAKRFNKRELDALRDLIALANRHGADAYVAIRFDGPRSRLLTVPAEFVAAEEAIRADLNGMDWPPQPSGP